MARIERLERAAAFVAASLTTSRYLRLGQYRWLVCAHV